MMVWCTGLRPLLFIRGSTRGHATVIRTEAWGDIRGKLMISAGVR